MLSFFPQNVLEETLDLIESVSEGFPTYSFYVSSLCRAVQASDTCTEPYRVYIGRLRKSGGQKINLISLLLYKSS